MEVNVTAIKELDCSQFSDSIFNSGLDNIGEITYRNACQYFEDNDLLVTGDDRDELRSWIADFGAWDSAEILSWSDVELNALLLQFIAGDIQEYEAAEKCGELESWEESFGGRLYGSDDTGWYYYVGG